MKQAFAAAVFLLLLRMPVAAQDVPATATLKAWAEGALPQCPDGALTLEPVQGDAGLRSLAKILASPATYELGVNAYVVKPVNFSVFHVAV
jgi:hypothetical protein